MINLFGKLFLLMFKIFLQKFISQILFRSGLEPEDMQVVYNYLVGTLLPAYLEKELDGGSIPRNSSSPLTSSHYGK